MKYKPSGRMRQLFFCYVLTIGIVTAIACYFSYQQQRAGLLNRMDSALLRLESEYGSITENFWDIYLPVFENSDENILKQYFFDAEPLPPYSMMELKTVLQRMAQRDNRIRWAAVYAPAREVNYIYFTESNTLQRIPQGFAYEQEAAEKTTAFAIWGEKETPELVLAGGPPLGSGKGSVLIAYDTSALHQLAEHYQEVSGLAFGITWRGRHVWGAACDGALPDAGTRTVRRQAGEALYIAVSDQTPQASRLFYSVPYRQIWLYAHRYTPGILAVVAFFVFLSLMAYRYAMRSINREVGFLRQGLEELGRNHLTYRIDAPFTQPDFAQIAAAVNTMAADLKENIDRVQEYQRKQRDAEMQELQAKFNPHFLYNSLDLFRARCYENGDDETADLIADTAAIFRGFINPHTFIPLREEMAFSRRYLSLFRARYGDAVEIRYDMDPAMMDYGIIRNVFQPVIENYFVHGIDTTREDNVLLFRGSLTGDAAMQIVVEDNGQGMKPEAMAELNRRLQEPISSEQESYGLKNLSQRLRLFYGEGYGLELRAAPAGGLAIVMTVARLTCEQAAQENLL